MSAELNKERTDVLCFLFYPSKISVINLPSALFHVKFVQNLLDNMSFVASLTFFKAFVK